MASTRRSYSTEYLLEHPTEWMSLLQRKPETYWIKRGQHMMMMLFDQMRRRVPAYKRFLTKHHTHRIANIQSIPIIDKDSYLRKYTLGELCWDHNLSNVQRTISATSGSTGEPFYFPRSIEQDKQYAAVAEMYLRNNFSIHKKSTLYIIGWGLGVWIGGIFSFAAVRILAERGKYPLSIITTGISEDEILKAVRKLGPLYDQVIIGGYPPMVKDVIDRGIKQGISWGSYHVKFIFSAEGFSERFRDYVASATELTNIYTDTLNHYGTVDLGTMAHETPLSVLIRRLALNNPELNTALFGHPYRQPTLAQYVPELFYFEERNGQILCSARSGLPLVRYNLIDTGGVRTLREITDIMKKHNVDIGEEAVKAGIADRTWNLPFVYVFERSDFTVKLYGANIFPQEIRRALEHEEISPFVTGKFTMVVDYDEKVDQRLTITIELRSHTHARTKLSERITEEIIKELLVHNSEYANNYRGMEKEKNTPTVLLAPYGQAPLFSKTGKHRWVRKSTHELLQ